MATLLKSGFITSDTALALTDIDMFSNRSFEDGTIGVVPTGWTAGGVSNAQKSSTRFFNRGYAPGAHSCRFQPTIIGLDQITQDTIAGVGVLAHETGLMFAMYPDGPTQPRVNILVQGLTVADAPVDSLNITITPGWTIGAWNFVQLTGTFTNTNITKWRIIIKLLSGTSGEFSYIDYLHFGLVHDFKRKVETWRLRDDPDSATFYGDNVYQTVDMGNPELELNFGLDSVYVGSDTDDAVISLYSELMEARDYSIWKEQNLWTNQEGHFERCVTTRQFKRELEAGIPRYEFKVQADIPRERRVIDHVRQA